MGINSKLVCLMLATLFLSGCQKKEDNFRSPVKLGVTPWPAEYSLASVESAYRFISQDCDFVMHMMDDGIPYAEAFHRTAMPKALTDDIAFRKLNTGSKPVFLSLSALSLTRDSRAGYFRQASETSAETKVYWESLPFDHPDVITAYVNYVDWLAGQFLPQWINFGVESNLATWEPAAFAQYKTFLAGVYLTLKQKHPDLPIFLSLMVNESDQSMEYARQLLPYSDWVALSAYPYTMLGNSEQGNTDPVRLPANYFERWLDLAPSKPWCFAETGYIAQDLTVPEYNLHKLGKPEWQASYLKKIGDLARKRNGRFITWFCYTDYDALIPALEATGLYQPLFLFWRDTGLYDENHQPRPALQNWRDLRMGK